MTLKKKTIINNTRDISFIFLLVIIGFLLLWSGVSFFAHSSAENQKQTYKKARVAAAEATAVPTATLTPTPQPSPSPTAQPTLVQKVEAATQPANGYCLSVPVIFYHHIQPQADAQTKGQTSLSVDNGVFDGQMQYLSTHGYNTISTQQLVTALKNHSGLAPKSIAVTIDDGYKDNYTYAFPILQKYHINADIMLASGLMGGADYLSWDQVSEMARSGLIHFTDHTWSHYSVNKGPLDKIKFEIETARQQIQDHTGQQISVFTYPYGSTGALATQVLQQDGFLGAFTTIPGTWQCDSYIFALHRTRIGNAPLSSYGL